MRKINTKRSGRNAKSSLSKNKLFLISGVLLVTLFVAVSQVKLPQNVNSRAQATPITNCDINPTDAAIDSEEQKLFDLINDYRERNGAVRLKMSPNLTRAATWLAADMNRSGRLDHTDSTSRQFALRVVQCGYDGNSSAENISNRSADANLVLEGWAASPPHNSNMLNTRFTVAGIARSGGWWTLDFGSTDDSNAAPLPSAAPSSGMQVPSAAPSGGVPNPGCLGACPTITPNQPTATPPLSTISQGPDTPTDPTNNPIDPNPDGPDTPENPEVSPILNPDGGGNGEKGGLINFLLEFLKLILEFFLSIFSGGRN